MAVTRPLSLDAAIFGGGAAGLWLLDELTRRGYRVLLLDAGDLGSGQTVASQGIIHGGMKYSLGGLLTPAARSIRRMPLIWRRCLSGEREPNLERTRLRSEFCYLWQTKRMSSRVSMLGARIGLAVRPDVLPPEERPEVLAACPGEVARLDEQVIEPATMVTDLADRHRGRLLRIDVEHGLEFDVAEPGRPALVRLINPDTGDPLDLAPGHVILTAGAGYESLRQQVGLPAAAMQRRPLHMVMVRGRLPWLNGHCVDGGATRVTITSTQDCRDEVVWQVGGQVAERGVDVQPDELIERARTELALALPGLTLNGAQLATYRADRAEPRTAMGRRPDLPHVSRVGTTLTAWPTKLALVPRMVDEVLAALDPPAQTAADGRDPQAELEADLPPWPRPEPALPPWETEVRWT